MIKKITILSGFDKSSQGEKFKKIKINKEKVVTIVVVSNLATSFSSRN